MIIYKYPIGSPGSIITHEMPPEAKFLHLDFQPHEPFPIQAWFELPYSPSDYTPTRLRTFTLVGTGMSYQGKYLGTIVDNEDQSVWHLIEE